MAKYKNIFDAIWDNNIEAVKAFLPKQLEMRDKWNWTPIHYVCIWNRTEMARLLLDSGADIEAKDEHGRTPLHKCGTQGNKDAIAKLLLDRGANIEARDNKGRTPLCQACDFGAYEASEFFVKNGADPMVLNNYGKSALYYDNLKVNDESGNKVPHKEILMQLRAEYLNKHALEASERTNTLSSGWEMEM